MDQNPPEMNVNSPTFGGATMEKRGESPSDLPTAPSNTRRLLEARSKFRALTCQNRPGREENRCAKIGGGILRTCSFPRVFEDAQK
jgi:hypothetical protein